MRLEIIKIAFWKNRLACSIPIVLLYVIFPIIGYFEYSHSGLDSSLYTLIFTVQALFPLSSLLLPMAHFVIWFNPNGNEVLITCSAYHRSCTGEILYFCLCIASMLFPASLLFNLLYGPLVLEFVRLYAQCVFSISLLYLCTVCCKNTTLGALPVVVYLFLCICLNDLPEYNTISILELQSLANSDSIVKYILLYTISLIFIIIGNITEKNWKISKNGCRRL